MEQRGMDGVTPRRRARGARALLLAGLTAALAAGCSGWEPMDYTPIHEIPEGKGAFSGDDGEWVWIGSQRPADEDEQQQTGSE